MLEAFAGDLGIKLGVEFNASCPNLNGEHSFSSSEILKNWFSSHPWLRPLLRFPSSRLLTGNPSILLVMLRSAELAEPAIWDQAAAIYVRRTNRFSLQSHRGILFSIPWRRRSCVLLDEYEYAGTRWAFLVVNGPSKDSIWTFSLYRSRLRGSDRWAHAAELHRPIVEAERRVRRAKRLRRISWRIDSPDFARVSFTITSRLSGILLHEEVDLSLCL